MLKTAADQSDAGSYEFNGHTLFMKSDRIVDSLGSIELKDIPECQPGNPLELKGGTPLLKRMWKSALYSIETNIVSLDSIRYFGAGQHFGVRVYTRDISFSGVMGLNSLYPDIMKESLEMTRKLHLGLGFTVSKGYVVKEIDVDWDETDMDEKEFLAKYRTDNYIRRTDDVIWLWCAEDLVERTGKTGDWQWIYDRGMQCFEKLYNPFFDRESNLYRGQPCFIDITFRGKSNTGYPDNYTVSDCILLKALSTNCLYVKGLQVMEKACKKLGREEESNEWKEKSENLKMSIRQQFTMKDGSLCYYIDRYGRQEQRHEALGTALAVLFEVVTGENAQKAVSAFPATEWGIPLLHPFYSRDDFYHNNSSWPFVDTYFIKALEKIDGLSRTNYNFALLGRTCQKDGFLHEVVDMRDGSIRGSTHQLWSAAAFVETCKRAGLVEI